MQTYADRLFVDDGLLERAEQTCRLGLGRDPAHPALLRSLAEVHRKQGNLAAARGGYQRLYELDERDQEAAYLSAVLGGVDVPQPQHGMRAATFAFVEDFLPRDFHDALLFNFVSAQEQFSPVATDRLEETIKPDSRQAMQYRGKWPWRRFNDAFMDMFRRTFPRLDLPAFEFGEFEVVVRAYQDGHFFKIHRDAPLGSRYESRAVNFVYYFHRTPKPYTGGDLLLFDTDVEADSFASTRFTRIRPVDNAIVVFPCNFYHCVVPVRCPSPAFADSRFVINGHLHRRADVASAAAARTDDER
jgi:Rps23 Pro-64 3,4-dihydroxylase Tpa1-like proline 4-hydroxylase